MKRQFTQKTDTEGVVVTVAELGGDAWLVSTEAQEQQLEASVRRAPDGTLLVTRGGVTRVVHASRVGDDVWLSGAAGTTTWQRHEERRGASGGAADSVSSPMTGKVVVVHVTPGDAVSKGDVLVVVEAMKMEQPLAAPRDGVVAKVACSPGELVDGGVELVVLAPEGDEA